MEHLTQIKECLHLFVYELKRSRINLKVNLMQEFLIVYSNRHFDQVWFELNQILDGVDLVFIQAGFENTAYCRAESP